MYSAFKKAFSGAIAAMLIVAMSSPAVLAEEQAAVPEDAKVSVEETAEETVEETAEAPSLKAEPSEASEPSAQPETSNEPSIEEVTQAEAAVDAETAPAEPQLVEIQEEAVPLAGGPAPSVAIRASRDIRSLQIGDELVLTAELSGFDGMEYSIRWQALKDGQWKDLRNEHSARLAVEITKDNAAWAYRVAVDATAAR